MKPHGEKRGALGVLEPNIGHEARRLGRAQPKGWLEAPSRCETRAGVMRVVAGRLRGRHLRAPPGTGTRPTADRVRQALFAVLGDMDGISVADLYAGSGALGIEALSRGARHAVFVESARGALRALRANLESLGLGGCSAVLPLSVHTAKRRVIAGGPYDLVVCDPPWHSLGSALGTLSALIGMGLLVRQGLLVVEHPKAQAVELAGGLALTETRHWGGTAVSIFQ